MLANSFTLWIIFIGLCIASIIMRKQIAFRNGLLLIASYIFYAAFAWQFLWILLLSTGVAFVLGIALEKMKYKNSILAIGIIFFLGILAYLKYRNFFIGSANSLLPELDWPTSLLILPLGISFYFFEAIGYLIDVRKQRFPASKNLLEFALFIGFFPKIVLGPIERAAHLLPQLRSKTIVDWETLSGGMRLIVWGIFKKLVIADQLGVVIAHRSDIAHAPAATLLMIAYLYAFQLYFDFSGYTDIAIGSARLFGISLLPNFRRPYASTSITEFWRRWHMSLSLWLRDYLYIPLGGNRVSNWHRYLNVFIVFLLSGLWHGAAWTFVVWGCIHGSMMIVGMLTAPFRTSLKNSIGLTHLPHLDHAVKVFCTFHLIVLAWIMFYASSLNEALSIYARLFTGVWHFLHALLSGYLPTISQILRDAHVSLSLLIFIILVICGVEYVECMKERKTAFHSFDLWSAWIRWPTYYALFLAIILFGRYETYSFIYVRF